jgi:UMF1 family MFS transporter
VSWAFYDWAGNAFNTVILTFVFAAYFIREVAENESMGTAQWGYTVGMAGLIVALLGPILGAMVDRSGRRKPWIAAFTLLCVTATTLLWFVRPSPAYVWRALLLVWLGTLGLEFATIFYNSMLPELVRPDRLGRWSGWGWSMGYIGGMLCLVAALFAFVMDDPWFGLDREAAGPERATFLFAAGWYLIFSLPLLLVTPDTPSTGKRFGEAGCDSQPLVG